MDLVYQWNYQLNYANNKQPNFGLSYKDILSILVFVSPFHKFLGRRRWMSGKLHRKSIEWEGIKWRDIVRAPSIGAPNADPDFAAETLSAQYSSVFV